MTMKTDAQTNYNALNEESSSTCKVRSCTKDAVADRSEAELGR